MAYDKFPLMDNKNNSLTNYLEQQKKSIKKYKIYKSKQNILNKQQRETTCNNINSIFKWHVTVCILFIFNIKLH